MAAPPEPTDVTGLNADNMLVCVFSFNMGATLENCLRSIDRNLPGFNVVIMDDQSDDPQTLEVISKRSSRIKLIVSTADKMQKRHGNLYVNIQHMCDLARSEGYRFLFMVQDDMQFVRPFGEQISRQYFELFSHSNVLQIDPRFHRGSSLQILPEMNAYCFKDGDYRRSYADVGILDLQKVADMGWRFEEGEIRNKKILSSQGWLRVFPYTPIMMHVPFPRAYRKGKLRSRFSLLNRGHYFFSDMTEQEIMDIDNRPISKRPYFRDYLRPQGMRFAKLLYAYKRDSKLFK